MIRLSEPIFDLEVKLSFMGQNRENLFPSKIGQK